MRRIPFSGRLPWAAILTFLLACPVMWLNVPSASAQPGPGGAQPREHTFKLQSRQSYESRRESGNTWEGEIELYGRKRVLGFQGNPADANSRDNVLILREHDWAINDLARIPMAEKLFLDGHFYELALRPAPAQTGGDLMATFREIDAPLGACELAGDQLTRLVLTKYQEPANRWQPEWVAVLDHPAAGRVMLPAGLYHGQRAYMGNKSAGFFFADKGLRLEITPERPARLQVGGPPRSDVQAAREGCRLRLTWHLAEMGGENYYPVREPDRWNAVDHPWPETVTPHFAVYKGSFRLASGAFGRGFDMDDPIAWVNIPPFIFGRLTVAAAPQEMAGLGPAAGNRVEVDWPWQWGLVSLTPWLLVGLLLCLRSNRHRQAWLALAPVALVYFLFFLVRSTGFPEFIIYLFESWAIALVFGLCVLWLSSAWLGRLKPLVAALAALGVMGTTCGLTFIARSGVNPRDTLTLLPLVVSLALALTAALALAGYFSRKRFSMDRFYGWLLLWIFLLGEVAVIGSFAFRSWLLMGRLARLGLSARHHIAWNEMLHNISQAFFFCIMAFMIVLPFVIIAHFTQFYRERLRIIITGSNHNR